MLLFLPLYTTVGLSVVFSSCAAYPVLHQLASLPMFSPLIAKEPGGVGVGPALGAGGPEAGRPYRRAALEPEGLPAAGPAGPDALPAPPGPRPGQAAAARPQEAQEPGRAGPDAAPAPPGQGTVRRGLLDNEQQGSLRFK